MTRPNALGQARLRCDCVGETHVDDCGVAASDHFLVVHHQILVADDQNLVADHHSAVAGHHILVAGDQNLVADHQNPVAHHHSAVASHHILVADDHGVVASHHFLVVDDQKVVADHHILVASHQKVLNRATRSGRVDLSALVVRGPRVKQAFDIIHAQAYSLFCLPFGELRQAPIQPLSEIRPAD